MKSSVVSKHQMRNMAFAVALLMTMSLFEMSTAAPLIDRTTRLERMIENYEKVLRTRDCDKVRSIASNIYHDAIFFEMEHQISWCTKKDGASFVDKVKRIICVIDTELNFDEKIIFLALATIYSLAFLLLSIAVIIAGSAIYDLIRACCYAISSSERTKTLMLQISTRMPVTTYKYYKSSDTVKIVNKPRSPPPPPYERV